MTNRSIRRLTNKEIREIAEDEIPIALERLMGGSHDARAIAFTELIKFARAIIACAIATPAPEELEPNDPDVGRILRLAEIVREVDGKHELGAAALAEAILAHPGFSGCHNGPAASAVSPVEPSPVAISEAQNIGEDELYTEWYRCPQCKDDMITRASNFCPKCGVKLQWE